MSCNDTLRCRCAPPVLHRRDPLTSDRPVLIHLRDVPHDSTIYSVIVPDAWRARTRWVRLKLCLWMVRMLWG